MALLEPPTNSTAELWLRAYCVSILGFLGGIRWGGEVARDQARWSVLVPAVLLALLGWAIMPYVTIVLFEPQPAWWLAYAGLFGAAWLWDVMTSDLPVWFKPLRTIASVGAVATCVAAWVVTSFL